MKDERGPGLYFSLCFVRQSSVRGCRFSIIFVYFIIKVFKCSPVPASSCPYLLTSLQYSRSLESYRQVCLIWVGAKLCRTPALQDQVANSILDAQIKITRHIAKVLYSVMLQGRGAAIISEVRVTEMSNVAIMIINIIVFLYV